VEVDAQEIKSEEDKQKTYFNCLKNTAWITQEEEYDTKVTNDPVMLRMATIYCYKK